MGARELYQSPPDDFGDLGDDGVAKGAEPLASVRRCRRDARGFPGVLRLSGPGNVQPGAKPMSCSTHAGFSLAPGACPAAFGNPTCAFFPSGRTPVGDVPSGSVRDPSGSDFDGVGHVTRSRRASHEVRSSPSFATEASGVGQLLATRSDKLEQPPPVVPGRPGVLFVIPCASKLRGVGQALTACRPSRPFVGTLLSAHAPSFQSRVVGVIQSPRLARVTCGSLIPSVAATCSANCLCCPLAACLSDSASLSGVRPNATDDPSIAEAVGHTCTPGEDEDPLASMPCAHVGRSYARPLSVIPERGQGSEYGVQPTSKER